jgi:hypothetical protein
MPVRAVRGGVGGAEPDGAVLCACSRLAATAAGYHYSVVFAAYHAGKWPQDPRAGVVEQRPVLVPARRVLSGDYALVTGIFTAPAPYAYWVNLSTGQATPVGRAFTPGRPVPAAVSGRSPGPPLPRRAGPRRSALRRCCRWGWVSSRQRRECRSTQCSGRVLGNKGRIRPAEGRLLGPDLDGRLCRLNADRRVAAAPPRSFCGSVAAGGVASGPATGPTWVRGSSVGVWHRTFWPSARGAGPRAGTPSRAPARAGRRGRGVAWVLPRSDRDVDRAAGDRVRCGMGRVAGRVGHVGAGVGHRLPEQLLPVRAGEVPRAGRAGGDAAATGGSWRVT